MSARQTVDRSADFARLLALLKSGDNYILTTHKNCDPDGIGSELGLFFLLMKLGKTVSILNPDKTPLRYQFIDPQIKIHVFDPEKLQSGISDSTVVIVDNSELNRIGPIQDYLKSDRSNLIIVDHHNEVEVKNPGIFSFPEIGSTSEIIYELIELSGIIPDYNTAVALYLGIIMDTGQFKYNKTRPRTHEIASRLLQNNFQTEELSRKLFDDFPYQKLLLKRDV